MFVCVAIETDQVGGGEGPGFGKKSRLGFQGRKKGQRAPFLLSGVNSVSIFKFYLSVCLFVCLREHKQGGLQKETAREKEAPH